MKYLVLLLLTVNVFAKENYEVNYNIDIPIILTSGIITYFPGLINSKLPDYMKDETFNKDDVNFIDKPVTGFYSDNFSTASDVMITTLMATPFIVNAFDNSLNNYFTESTIFLETILVNSALTNIIKYSVKRPRPYLYGDEASDEKRNKLDSRLSFFSGHSSTSFAVAVSFASIYSKKVDKTYQKVLIWTIPLLTASTIASFRVIAGRHFFTDVFAGMIVGSSIGYLIPYLHLKSDKTISTIATKDSIFIGYGGTF